MFMPWRQRFSWLSISFRTLINISSLGGYSRPNEMPHIIVLALSEPITDLISIAVFVFADSDIIVLVFMAAHTR